MAEYLSPSVYVEEVSGGTKPIEGVGTSTGAFIGIAEKGPIVGAAYEGGVFGRPLLITRIGDFTRNFGRPVNGEYLTYAVNQFFTEGGTRCFVARTAHFADPSDAATLSATRATIPLRGISTTLSAALNAGSTQASLTSMTGIQTGMILFIHEGTNAVRVTVTNLPGGNDFDFTPEVPAGTNISNGALVTQVILDVNAINW